MFRKSQTDERNNLQGEDDGKILAEIMRKKTFSYSLIIISFIVPLVYPMIVSLVKTQSTTASDASGSLDIPALYISLVILAVGFVLERQSEHYAAEIDRRRQNASTERILKRFDSQVNRLDHTLRNTFNVETLHTASDWMQTAITLTKDATLVRNTFITIGDKNQLSPEVSSLYTSFLCRKDGPTWKDIVSINELYSGRYDQIFPNNCADSGGIPGSHEIVVIRQGMPITNFTIFSFADKSPVVLFGWAYGKHHSPGKVFQTSDRDLVTMFENLFESIAYSKGISTISVDYRKSMPERIYAGASDTIINKKGLWYTHAYDAAGVQVSASILKIDFVGGSPHLEGIIGGKDGDGPYEPVSHISDSMIHHSHRAIYAEYVKNEGNFKVVMGFVMHYFSYEDGKDVISGFFVDDRFGNQRMEILGVRCSKSDRMITGSDLKNEQAVSKDRVERIRDSRRYRRVPNSE